MGDRTVKVSLLLQAQGYMQGVKEAGKATDEFGSKAEQLAAKKQGFETLGRAAVGVGAAMALGVGIAISKWAEFDQQMSYVQAATHETAANMDLLKEAALDAGARTVYSATEAASAIEELARAGVSTQDILAGGLDAALDLAAAGGLEVAEAAGIAAVALKTFNLQGTDMSHVADLLAAGAGKAMGDVSQLSQALAQGGQVAKQTGLSIEETTAGLAAFAAQGLLGSDAGTSFKSMLQRLTPQSSEAKAKMDELGISAYDASGNFVGLAEFAGNLQGALRSLTPEQRNSAMATIFGSDAVRAATVLYDEGETGIRSWIDAVDDQGYAAETAAMRLDNLVGDWEAFTGALDTAFITMGEGTDGPLRTLVQGLTGLVDGFNDLPDGAQQAVMWIGLVTAGVALTGGAALLAIPKIAAFQVGMQTLGITAAGTRAGLGRVASFLGGPWGIAIVAATALMATYNRVMEEGVPSQAEITNAIQGTATASDKLAAAIQKNKIFPQIDAGTKSMLSELPTLLNQAAEASDNWFVGLLKSSTASDEAFETLNRYGDALAGLAQTDLPSAQLAFRGLADEHKLTEAQTRTLLEQMTPYRDALLEVADGQEISADSAEFLALAMGKTETTATSAAEAYMEQASVVGDLQTQLSSLIDTINEANGVGQDAITQNIQYQETLAEVRQAIADGASGLDIATEAGQDNMAMLVGLAADAQSAAQAQLELDGSTSGYTARMSDGRQALIDAAIAMGATADEAVALADQIYAIPTTAEITAIMHTAEAQKQIDNFVNRNGQRTISIWANVKTQSMNDAFASYLNNATGNLYDKGKQATAFAAGGAIGFAAGGTPPHIASATNGGLLKYAEAGWAESFITMNPAYRDRSLDIWAETGRRLGAWQPAPPSYGVAAAPQSAGAGNSYKFGDIYGLDPAQIVGEMNKEVRRAMAMSGLNEGVSD